MKRKLEIHLLPHFGQIPVTELTSRDVEAYLDRKLAENRRVEAALGIGEPLIDRRGRALQPLQSQTINSHLHLLSEIIARALVEAAGTLDQRPAPSDELLRRILDMPCRGQGLEGARHRPWHRRVDGHLPRQPHRQPPAATLSAGGRHAHTRRATRERAVRAELRARRSRPPRAAGS